MSTIQEQMMLYHVIETVLREAGKRTLTLRDIWEKPDVKVLTPKEHTLRDRLRTLVDRKLVIRHEVSESDSGSKQSRIGYTWANLDKSVEEMKMPRKNVVSTPPAIVVELPLELNVYGTQIVLGKGIVVVAERDISTGRVKLTLS